MSKILQKPRDAMLTSCLAFQLGKMDGCAHFFFFVSIDLADEDHVGEVKKTSNYGLLGSLFFSVIHPLNARDISRFFFWAIAKRQN